METSGYGGVPSDGDDVGNGMRYYVGFNSTSGTPGFNTTPPSQLVDSNAGAEQYKYCVGNFGTSITKITTEFHYSKAFVPKMYYLHTAEDNSVCTGRNPKSWKIYAKEESNGVWKK